MNIPFQKSMPSLSQMRPVSYTDLPGFAGSGTPLFRNSPSSTAGVTAQLMAASAPGADTENGGAEFQKKVTPMTILLVIVLALVLLH